MKSFALHPAGEGLAFITPAAEVTWLPIGLPEVVPRLVPGLAAPCRALAFSTDGSELLVAQAGGKVSVLDWRTGIVREVLPHPEEVELCAGGGRRRYATVDLQYASRLWIPGPEGEMRSLALDVDLPVYGVAFRAAGGEVCLHAAFDLVRYDVETQRIVERRELLDGTYLDAMEGQIAFSPDGEKLLIYWDSGSIVDVTSAATLYRFPFHTHAGGAAVSDSGERYALGFLDGVLRVADTEGSTLLERPVSRSEIVEVALSATGDVVAFADQEGRCGVLHCERDEWLIAPPVEV